MKIVKIKFVDFWEHWNQEDNFIVNTLKKFFKVEFSETPDYVFYSNFSKRLDHMKYKNAVKIFYTQENLCPDFNFADYGIGFEELTYGDRYLQFPICYIDERYGNAWRMMKTKHMDVQGNAEKYINREFCGMVVSNKDADPIRDEFFEKLLQYQFVSSGGKYRNNIGQPNGVPDKLEFMRKYRFSFCFENSSHPGYYTEKLIEGFAAKTVPIYWGNPHIEEIFNPNAFINLSDCESIDEMIEKVKAVDLDNEKYMYLQLSSPDVKKNVYQISHQIRMEKSASPVVKNNNRYDVTLLINGLPILQTELKRPGVDFTEAVNQVNRYRRDSFGGLFNFLQLFVVSNETATKYFSNQNRNQNGQFNKIQASMVFFWLTKTNERVVRLSEFADAVLTPERLTDILYNYMIIKKEEKQLIVMRPYQIYEVEAAVKRVVEENSNGFITACTGSGKTLTSFKTAQVLRDIPQIKKVIHLLDRIDLDDQTVAEFNSFEAGCVDYTENSKKLLKKLDSIH